MDSLTLRNFRCFYELDDLPIRPLTLLIGENSTGKSSFLAALRLAWDVAYSSRRIDFNEEPFLLGAFDQIAHFRGGRGGRAQTFELEFASTIRRRRRLQQSLPSRVPLSYGVEFRRSGSHPVVSRQHLRSGAYRFTVDFPENGGRPRFEIHSKEKGFSRTLDEEAFGIRIGPEAPVDWMYLLHSVADLREFGGRPLVEKTGFTSSEVLEIRDILANAKFGETTRPVAIAPVRTRPQRTYNPVSATPLPEGEHVPMVLARTFFESRERWETLQSVLVQFGEESGLFANLQIKALGQHESDPFQIRVKIEGPAANLVDVGYGVSQVLPILVDSLLADRGDLYLLQQPEVHLHPRAQAALGSFFARLVGTQSKRFIVETHSDFLVDRIRMDVRDRKIPKPESVLLLFFERRGIDVVVHPITIDAAGNLVRVPKDYRRFFLQEERRFLGG